MFSLFRSRSSSENTQNTTNNNKTIGIQDGWGIWGDQNVIHMTDGGMMEQGARVLSDLSSDFTGFGSDTVRSMERVTDNSLFAMERNTGRALDGMEGVSRHAISNVTDTAFRAMDSADYNVNQMRVLSEGSILAQNALTRDALQQNSQLAGMTIDGVTGLGGDLMAYSSRLAQDAMLSNADLADRFAGWMRGTQQDTTDAITTQTRYALQFADNMSRSDGQQLAVNTNKTVLWVAGLAAASMVLIAWGKK